MSAADISPINGERACSLDDLPDVGAIQALVEPLVQRRIAKLRLLRGDRVADGIAQRVEQRTVGLALVRRHAAEAFQQFADRALLAQRGDAHGFKRRFVARGRDGGEDFILQGIGHGHSTILVRHRSGER